MKTYETSATVEDHGQVRVAGVPFAPGTEVELMIREKVAADADRPPANAEEARVPMRDLFARAGTEHRAGRAAASRGAV